MANLAGDGEEGVSLFPMFNILACTLGVMVFVLATVATVSLGADKAVEFVSDDPTNQMQGRTPTYMEWNGRALTLQPTMQSVEFEQDLATFPTLSQTYAYMFERLAQSPVGNVLANTSLDGTRYIILLVRPSGFATLPDVEGYLENRLGIYVVPEPIDQDLRRMQVR